MKARPLDKTREQYTRMLLAFAAAALVLTLAREGSAETPDVPNAPSVPNVEQRRADLLKGAAAALRGGRPLEAIAKWRAAWEIRPASDLACDIGTGEFMYGSQPAAAEFLARCEREHPASSPRDKKRKEEIKKRLTQAREQVGALHVDVDVVGAAVSIDGRHVGRTPLDTQFVEPGEHRVHIVLEGYKRHDVVAVVGKGEERALRIKLAKIEPSAPAAPAIKSGPIPPTPALMPAPKSGGPELPIAITGGALALVSAGIGVGFTAASNDAADEGRSSGVETSWRLQGDCNAGATQPPCSKHVSAEQARRDYGRVAATAFIGAGVLTVATIVYVAFPLAFPRTFAKPAGRRSGAALTVHAW
jgi:hypothetical protein